MMIIIIGVSFALAPFVFSLLLHQGGKCSIWMVILSPVIGLFIFATLMTCLLLLSGDM